MIDLGNATGMRVNLKAGTFTSTKVNAALALAREISALDCIESIEFSAGDGRVTLVGKGWGSQPWWRRWWWRVVSK